MTDYVRRRYSEQAQKTVETRLIASLLLRLYYCVSTIASLLSCIYYRVSTIASLPSRETNI
ncbi:MAG: hypothetical protein KME64_04930 [Scytonematopsis contorta HA4267-MV1]|nr:hypothetical protein [Scytonematopsis contorta HA4267-MV1]